MDHPAALSSARSEAAAGPAGPGRASSRRAERSSRRGRRAGGQAPRRSEIRRPGPKAPGTPAEHTKYRPMGGCRNPAGVKGAGGSGGHGRASRSTTPSAARVWRSRGRPGPKAPRTPAEHTKQRGRRAGGQAPRRSEIRRSRKHRRLRGRASRLYSPPTPGSGRPVKLTKRAMSPWKRAVTVAVAPARCLATMMSASPGRSSLS